MRGILRTAAAVPHLYLGDVDRNLQTHLEKLREAAEHQASLVVFPELSLTGYTCQDLFFQQTLQRACEQALTELAAQMPEGILAVVGAPIRSGGQLYNCAVFVVRDEILGIVPKTYLPNNSEFYEKRWFRSGADSEADDVVIGGESIPMGSLLFESDDGVVVSAEICEDLWTPLPPSTELCLSGAEVIVNLSASNELIAKREYRRQLISQQSARCQCAYVYVSAGLGESSSDLVFSGNSVVACGGAVLNENKQYIDDDYLLLTDIDLDRIRSDRAKQTSYGDCAARHAGIAVRLSAPLTMELPDGTEPSLRVDRHPFVPADRAGRQERCEQIFAMQSGALARRLSVTGGKLVLGISGGLDSTLALLAACRAMDRMGLPRTNITGITMPCFGTTGRTYQNSLRLMEALGVTSREIPIHEAVRQHFRDIGHDENDHSVTYENCQARERTQVLMDVANKTGGIVLGTGDLSEIALGWCTYNADHMSMYGVNSGVPKTLVRWIVSTVAEDPGFASAKDVLLDVLDTPISPELLPPDEKGNILQQTEDLVGPYALHDFFLYYVVRLGYAPEKIYQLCRMAFHEDFDDATILKWLKNFYRRFFNQQFKRNCMPDGVKIGSIALSPRGDWRMPADAVVSQWMRECEAL